MRVPKVGDKLVITSTYFQYDLPVGTVLTVKKVEEFGGKYWEVDVLEHQDNYYSSDQLEFEEIYNSPLYKIMQEEK